MIADWPRLLRLGLVICIGLIVYARPWHGHVPVAWADGDDDDDDDDDGGDKPAAEADKV